MKALLYGSAILPPRIGVTLTASGMAAKRHQWRFYVVV
jgi:hypothetical protein